MSNRYVIQWKSKVNGRAGRGSKLFERSEAERLVEELNREYPDIVHEVAESRMETPSSEPELGRAAAAQPEPEPSQPRPAQPEPTPTDPSHAFSE